MQSISSLPSFPGQLGTDVVAPDSVLFKVQIELNNSVLKLKSIVLYRTAFDI